MQQSLKLNWVKEELIPLDMNWQPFTESLHCIITQQMKCTVWLRTNWHILFILIFLQKRLEVTKASDTRTSCRLVVHKRGNLQELYQSGSFKDYSHYATIPNKITNRICKHCKAYKSQIADSCKDYRKRLFSVSSRSKTGSKGTLSVRSDWE